MEKIKVTREWAKDRLACHKSVRRFFERWPRGMMLSRRNLYMAADQLPMSDIMWFAGRLSIDNALDHDHTTEAKCASEKDSCVCKLPFAHDGDHVCECEGSWDEVGNVVAFPALVVEDGSPFGPKGSRPFEWLGL